MILDIKTIREKLAKVEIMQLSKKLGLHFNTLYRIARGESTPSYKVLEALSRYFNVES